MNAARKVGQVGDLPFENPAIFDQGQVRDLPDFKP
jgi:hypothetical protein